MVAPPLTSIEPSIDDLPAKLVVYQHHVVPAAQLPDVFGRAYEALYARIEHAGVAPAGPPFVIFGDQSIPGVEWHMDVCAPIAEPITPSGDIKYMELPATRVVSVLHVGPYDSLGATYEKLEIFLRTNGIVATGPPREIYLTPPDVPADQVQTLIERPIA